jgi:uncharacterized protein with HEPN domain
MLSKYSDVRPTIGARLDHIAAAIADIRKIMAGQSLETFTDNLEKRLAVERLPGIVSEASRFIPPDVKDRESGINWRRLADLGNWLRHAYHRTDTGLLWAMIKDDLEPLKICVERIAEELKH